MNWKGYCRGLISGNAHAFPWRDMESPENISQENWLLSRGFNPEPLNED